MSEPSHLYGKIIFYHVFLASLVEMICLVICEREEVTQELPTLDPAGKRFKGAKWLGKYIYCQSNPFIQTPLWLKLVQS